ncbi:hypothetical protein BGX31_011015 [Mortierella sp. GBA43]|nr:hypothetical protein BGX31_011015 [Mortierella sp. GBA43]
MFDIPELDSLVYNKLERRDVARCARVNKKWHRCASPFVWYEITFGEDSPHMPEATFCKLVIEDYLCERGPRWGSPKRSHHTQSLSSNFSSALTKYGPWIRKIPDLKTLLSSLNISAHINAQRLDLPIGRSEYPKPVTLLRHFYKRCHIMNYVQLRHEYFKTDLWRTIAEDMTLHVRHLHIGDNMYGDKVHSLSLKSLLDRLSTALEHLTLEVDIEHEKNKEEDVEMKDWASFKELELLKRYGASYKGSFWIWLWSRCAHVNRLQVTFVNESATQTLANAMWAHMPNLDTIKFKEDCDMLTDKQIATILSGSSKGWRVVDASNNINFGIAAMSAVTGHCGTLVDLTVNVNSVFPGNYLAQVLSSSPNLRVLAATDYILRVEKTTSINANVFIDRDPATGALKVWPCETSLKVLRVGIVGIPRPDLTHSNTTETDLSQWREMQDLVYQRLGRLVNLEVLSIGNDGPLTSVENGLEKLSRLKSLRELHITGMRAIPGVEDVRWMSRQWPKLSSVAGFDWHMRVR